MAWASRLDVADSMDDWMVADTRGLGAILKKVAPGLHGEMRRTDLKGAFQCQGSLLFLALRWSGDVSVAEQRDVVNQDEQC